jgi:drug/metabolite transporter (DMT)-like permease
MSIRPQGHMPLLELGLVLLLGFLWGSPYALTKISLETIPPITLVAARVSLAATALWLIAISRGYKVPKERRLVGLLFVQGIITCVVPYTLIAFGQQTVESGLAAILNSTTPLFVCVIGLLWTRHEPVTSGRVLGAAIGFSGVIAIAGASALLGFGHDAVGQAAIILATVSSAFSVIHGRRFDGMAPEVVAAGMLTAAAITLVPLSLIFESPWHISPSAPAIVALLINAVVATALGFAIYFRLIRTVGSLTTASVGYLKPAVGVLIGCLILGEPFTIMMALGLFGILLGMAIINGKIVWSGRPHEKLKAGSKEPHPAISVTGGTGGIG